MTKKKLKLEEEPEDPLVDQYDPLPPSALIDVLKVSRRMLAVVEADRRVFQEDVDEWREQSTAQLTSLQRRRSLLLAMLHDQSDRAGDKPYLPAIWIQYGRSPADALPFRSLPLDRIKALLRRRILTRYRHLDRMTFERVGYRRQAATIARRREVIVEYQREQREPGAHVFLTGLHNTWLQNLLRQTHEMIQGLKGHMTFFHYLRDAAAKFSRLKDYLAEDAAHFARILDDLYNRVRMQHKELHYLSMVFTEVKRSAVKAKRQYWDVMFDIRRTAILRKAIMTDIEDALKQHRDMCDRCIRDILAINTNIQKDYADISGLGPRAPGNAICVKQYPHAMLARRKISMLNSENRNPPPFSQESDAPHDTELQRSYMILKEMTLATTTEELSKLVRNQVIRALHLESSITRLQHLTTTVLRPEESRFAAERERHRVLTATRQHAMSAAYTAVQTTFEDTAAVARRIITAQRDNVDDFLTFHDILHLLIKRAGLNFATYDADMHYLDEHPGIDGLLDLTALTLHRVEEGQLAPFFNRNWAVLRDLVEDVEFLEYRGGKLPSTNNRLVFDSGPAHPKAEEAELLAEGEAIPGMALPLNPRFITHAQIKEANWRMMERSRMAELARLKQAAAEFEADRKAQARAEAKLAAAQAATKSKK
ncbi:uncharacterized protein LOC129599180 [Paramacrobiotus metropolitanus]|uniref:uncharacterized protein LOC129599180 n=1 Tax=Paramacrobiotus metropolitanus TaxID=2943436 RepID=UPI0024456819|nr:uncharacterized protein LOC129599180 [Paramacrobiotus metropolitanus]